MFCKDGDNSGRNDLDHQVAKPWHLGQRGNHSYTIQRHKTCVLCVILRVLCVNYFITDGTKIFTKVAKKKYQFNSVE